MVLSIVGLLVFDGCCKSFDVFGDGYGWGEGFVVVILKFLSVVFSDKDD